MKPSPRSIFFIILLLLFLLGVAITILLGIAMSVGTALARLSSFNFYESTLLSLISIGIIGIPFYRIIPSFLSIWFSPEDEEEKVEKHLFNKEDEEEKDFIYKEIPISRFYEKNNDKTWQVWLRYQLSNDIYMEFQEVPEHVPNMNDRQLQELTIRLADITIAILKAKTARAKQLHIPMSRFKQQMVKMDQKPYDDAILLIALEAINLDMEHYYDEILSVIHEKQWDEPTDMFEMST